MMLMLSLIERNHLNCSGMVLVVCITGLFVGWCLPAQSQPPFLLNGAENLPFPEIQRLTNEYYKVRPDEKGYKLWKRIEWLMESRLGPDGKAINLTRHNALEYWKYQRSPSETRSTHGDWLFLGPSSVSNGETGLGRLNAIAIHPINTNIIYVGSSNGGIWKTTTGGTNWTNISPFLPTLSIKDIIIDYLNPSRIFILTGDGYGIFSGQSLGILKTLDGGATWLPTGFSSWPSSTHKLLMHPTDPETQYCATSTGVIKTTNGWIDYSTIATFGALDIEFKPDDPNTLYIGGTSIYKKTGSQVPVLLTDPDFSFWPSTRYISLAVTADSPDCVYALVSSFSDPVGLYRSMSSGTSNTWTVQDTVMFNFGAQGFYNRILEVHPEDYERVVMGQVWTKVSYQGGIPGSWQGPVNYVHADAHDCVYTPTAIYHANDGGLFKSAIGDSIFDNFVDGLEITEIYGIAGTPQNINLYYCGTQDNGTFRRTSGSGFDHVSGGDGANCLINYSNSDTTYAMYQKGFLRKSIDGGDNFYDINPPGEGAWVSPLIMDPLDPEIIFIGKDTLYRSNEGGESGTWVNLENPVNGTIPIIALCQGVNNRNILYVGSNSVLDPIFKTTNALTASGDPGYINISGSLPNISISDIAVNPDNAGHVYVTNNELLGTAGSVYRCLNGDGPYIWEDISGSLPNVAVNCIVFHNNGLDNQALYIGTDIGVFYRDEDIGDWVYFSNNLPVTIITDLYLNTSANVLAAGTYGKGLWISDLYDGCNSSVNVTNPPGNPLEGIRYYSASIDINTTATHRQEIGTKTYYSAGNYIDMKSGFRAGVNGFMDAVIGPCPGVANLVGEAQQRQVCNFDYEAWIRSLPD